MTHPSDESLDLSMIQDEDSNDSVCTTTTKVTCTNSLLDPGYETEHTSNVGCNTKQKDITNGDSTKITKAQLQQESQNNASIDWEESADLADISADGLSEDSGFSAPSQYSPTRSTTLPTTEQFQELQEFAKSAHPARSQYKSPPSGTGREPT